MFEISIMNKSFKLIFTRHKGQGRTTGRRGSKPRGKKGKDGWQSSPPGAGECAPHWPRVLTNTGPKAPGLLQTKVAWTCPQKASLHSPLALEAEGAKGLYKTCPHFHPGLHNLSLKMTTQCWHRGANSAPVLWVKFYWYTVAPIHFHSVGDCSTARGLQSWKYFRCDPLQ